VKGEEKNMSLFKKIIMVCIYLPMIFTASIAELTKQLDKIFFNFGHSMGVRRGLLFSIFAGVTLIIILFTLHHSLFTGF